MFQGMNDTAFQVHTARLQEQLLKSERYHELTRADVLVQRQPRIVMRVVGALHRPTLVLRPQPAV